MITKQITHKAEFNYCMAGDAGHTHPESFPASTQRESVETMPCGPDWYYPAAIL